MEAQAIIQDLYYGQEYFIRAIRDVLTRIHPQTTVQHVNRKANAAADRLAALGSHLTAPKVWMQDSLPSDWLGSTIGAEIVGLFDMGPDKCSACWSLDRPVIDWLKISPSIQLFPNGSEQMGVNGSTPSAYSQTQTHTFIVKNGPRLDPNPLGIKFMHPDSTLQGLGKYNFKKAYLCYSPLEQTITGIKFLMRETSPQETLNGENNSTDISKKKKS
ncbi:hypothetical protein M9H77_01914 [Catharanthus roseus]|uniref:Uncharacterized protein n=1 Tax=Catharanthus roseus TaxID=4058 RepID=A0ACC0C745_CATRO|nr:hypothetical protein M9H77_01914 [Catharanthus roseus]